MNEWLRAHGMPPITVVEKMVGTRVKDMDVRKVGGVDSKISLKKAWTLMR